jgi:hypothetical protein
MLGVLKKIFPRSKPPASSSNYKSYYKTTPSNEQREDCESLGLTIKLSMTSYDVWRMINGAIAPSESDSLRDAFHSPDSTLSE